MYDRYNLFLWTVIPWIFRYDYLESLIPYIFDQLLHQWKANWQ
jgi:hypothetical protein